MLIIAKNYTFCDINFFFLISEMSLSVMIQTCNDSYSKCQKSYYKAHYGVKFCVLCVFYKRNGESEERQCVTTVPQSSFPLNNQKT